MPTTALVETIIRHAGQPPTDRGERLVLYDRRHHTVMDKRPWLSFGGHIENYAVRPDTWMDEDRIIRFTLKPARPLPVRLDAVAFYLAYRICCPAGKEAKAVSSLAGEADPNNAEGLTQALNRRLVRYVEDFAEGQGHIGGDFILDYFSLRGEAVKRLTARLLEEAGLLLRAQIQVEEEAGHFRLPTVDIETPAFSARVRDYEADLAIKLRGALTTSPQGAMHAILREQSLGGDAAKLAEHLGREVQAAARSFIVSQLGIHDFMTTRLGETRQQLKDHLNGVMLASEGRVFDFIDLSLSDPPTLPQERITFRHVVAVLAQGAEEPVPVEHTVAMNLENIARYQVARRRDPKAADPEAWIKGQLEPIARDALFNYSYADLVLRLRDKEIRQPLQAKAQEIGYSIRQYTALPQQPILRLKADGIRLTIANQTFATRDTRATVALDIAVTADLPESLETIKAFIRPDLDLGKEIQGAVINAAQDLLHGITPDRFYTEFSSVDPDTAQRPRRVPVERQLKEKIEKALVKRFCLRNLQVVPKMAANRLTKRFTDLCRRLYELDIPVDSLRDGGTTAPVVFSLQYKITGVAPNGWAVFQGNDYASANAGIDENDDSLVNAEIKEINKLLTASFQSAFGTLPGNWLNYRSVDQHAQIRHCAQFACNKVVEAFGLSISLTNLQRKLSDDEKAQRYQLETARTNKREQMESALARAKTSRGFDADDLEALRARRLKLVEAGLNPDDPEFKANAKHLANLRQEETELLRPPEAATTSPSDATVNVDRHIEGLVDPAGRVRELAERRRRKESGRTSKTAPAGENGQPIGDTPRES